jgi:hypothetical protein
MSPTRRGADQLMGGSELARKPSCSFQDGAPRGRLAKPLKRNALDPEPSCSLQDGGGGVFGHGCAAAAGSFPPLPGALSSTASDNRDVPPATSSYFRAPLDHRQDPSPASGGENRRGAVIDTPVDCKPFVEGGAAMAETTSGSRDNGGPRSCFLRVHAGISEENRNRVRKQQKSENAINGRKLTSHCHRTEEVGHL